MTLTRNALLLSSALTLGAVPVFAQSQGDMTFGLGVATINPKSGNGTLAGGAADIASDEAVTFTFEYFVRDNIGIELLASTPFKHGITIAGIGAAGSTEHLPPSLSANYHFPTSSAWKPYVGAGINYTKFFNEESPLGKLELDDSFGFSVQAGLDYELSPTSAVRVNLRWFDIDTDVTLNGAPIGTAEIDPILFGIAYVHKF